MDPFLATRPAVRNSKLNIFLWNFIKTLTICSMLSMVLSIHYSFFASEDGRNRGGGVLTAIIVVFAMISYTFIIPNLAQIAAVAIPFVYVNKHFSIRILKLVVWMTAGLKYPFLVHFLCFSQMAGVGLWKLYGDEGHVLTRVLYVISVDTLEVFSYMYGILEKDGSCGKEWLKSGGTGGALLGLVIMVLIANYLPPLMEPEEKKMNATATMKEMNMAEALIPEVGNIEDI